VLVLFNESDRNKRASLDKGGRSEAEASSTAALRLVYKNMLPCRRDALQTVVSHLVRFTAIVAGSVSQSRNVAVLGSCTESIRTMATVFSVYQTIIERYEPP
jgi:hypothetical protein